MTSPGPRAHEPFFGDQMSSSPSTRSPSFSPARLHISRTRCFLTCVGLYEVVGCDDDDDDDDEEEEEEEGAEWERLGWELLDLQVVNMDGSLFRTDATDEDLVFKGLSHFDPLFERSGKAFSFLSKENSRWL